MLAVILGLPGTGKTRLALELAASLAARDRSVHVLHTDLLKVTARTLAPDAPRGPAYRGDIDAKRIWYQHLLHAHADKAERDETDLVIEGTLAVGFTRGVTVLLELDEAERRARVINKHQSAVQDLSTADLSGYAARLSAATYDDVHRLDASETVPKLVSNLLGLLDVQ